MASYRGHLMFSTALGGLMPDLDSDSGVPVRELFGAAAVLTPLLLYPTLPAGQLSFEQALVVLAGVYLFVRYALASVFKHCSVHRGMFHSVPALLIAGLTTYLAYPSNDRRLRLLLAGGVMLGFLSHLVLDELCSVDFMGVRLHLNKYAGSALKFVSRSWSANLVAYSLLALLAYRAWLDWPLP